MDGPKEQKPRSEPPQDRPNLTAAIAADVSAHPDSTTSTLTVSPKTPTGISEAQPLRAQPSRRTSHQRIYSPRLSTRPRTASPRLSLTKMRMRSHRSDDHNLRQRLHQPVPRRTTHMRREQ